MHSPTSRRAHQGAHPPPQGGHPPHTHHTHPRMSLRRLAVYILSAILVGLLCVEMYLGNHMFIHFPKQLSNMEVFSNTVRTLTYEYIYDRSSFHSGNMHTTPAPLRWHGGTNQNRFRKNNAQTQQQTNQAGNTLQQAPRQPRARSQSQSLDEDDDMYMTVPPNFLYNGKLNRSVAPVLPTSSQKRILVTGGAGFIGSHLVDK
jgi:hypothetical protein